MLQFSDSSSSPPPKSSSTPTSSQPPLTSPTPPPSFTSIIDADHAAINTAAQRLAHALRDLTLTTPPTPTNHSRQTILTLLHDVTWRLIRHDLSEDIVMRPAFTQHMGAAGLLAAQHDRDDHDRARLTLLELYDGFSTALSSTSTSTPSSSSSSSSHDTSPPQTQTIQALTTRYLSLMRDLAEHMRRESGEELPDLERRLGREQSVELGQRYAETLVVTPDLVLRDSAGGGDGDERGCVWAGVGDYVRADKGTLLAVWEEVCRERWRERGVGRGVL
jgi:hypothetical protein